MTYHRPRSLDEALAHLAEAPLTVAAGCTDLFPATEAPVLSGPILDVTAIDGLRGVTRRAGGWRFGAATTWADVIQADLPPAFDALKAAAREVGSVQIQTAGTLAGNLCTASPAADGAPCLLALEASVELTSALGARRLPLAAFLTGPRQTARRAEELVTAIEIPARAAAERSAFKKLGARRYLVISIAMVAVNIVEAEGNVASAAIAVGACSPTARRMTDVETALVGQPLAAAAEAVEDDAVAAALAPIDDIRGPADYRCSAATELIRQALAQLAVKETA